MTPDESTLWSAIAAYPLAGGDGIDLAGQLVAKQGWARPFAEGAVEEYRRFCFLACIADFMVSPSEEVDEVWHLHMLHSRDYWDRWCADVLGRKLHHEPGAPGEARRFHEGYARTLALYEDYFGQPSEAFWPGTRQRFRARARFRTVDRDRVMVMPRPPSLGLLGRLLPLAVVLVLLAVAMPAMALPLGPLD